jgi:hypothetical protein
MVRRIRKPAKQTDVSPAVFVARAPGTLISESAMRSMSGLLALLAGTALMCGCSAYYQVIRIPDTPDALAAYQQCATTASDFSEVGACLTAIPDATTTGWVIGNSQSDAPGCRQMMAGSYYTNNFWSWPFPDVYHHYSVQACPSPTLK